jgi:hypothetical protein
MNAVDGELVESAMHAAETALQAHKDIVVRVGLLSVILGGFVGGTFAFFKDPKRREIKTRRGTAAFYIAKWSSGTFAAYIAQLLAPLLVSAITEETEQAIAILAGIIGADIIGFFLRRLFGSDVTLWDGDSGRHGERNDVGGSAE